MDHQTFAQLLGNYGEFFGAIAVVVTLIYLAGQLRQNTNALRSSTYEAWNQATSGWAEYAATHATAIAAIEEKSNWDTLSSEEMIVYNGLVMKTFYTIEAAYLHHRAGAMDDDVFDARIAGYKVYLDANPMLRMSWRDTRTTGTINYTPEFMDFLERKIPSLITD
jgi:hypothetical protein